MTNGMTLLDEVAMVSPHKISIKHVTHTYGVGDKAVHALGPVTLDIAEGEFTCLVGPSGCGKSTLLRAIAGLASPSDGQIDLRLPPTHRASVATVFQDYGIFPWKTVEGNVRFALGVLKLSKADARERTDLWLERLGLLDFRRAYPSQLSGGMRQRVAIARAMDDPDFEFVVPTAEPGDNIGGVQVGPKLLERRDVALAFTRAYIRTINTYFKDENWQDDDELMDAMSAELGLPAESLRAVPGQIYNWDIPEGPATALQELYISTGTMQGTDPLPESDFIDRSFIAQVVGQERP